MEDETMHQYTLYRLQLRFRPGILPVLPVYCPKIKISILDSRLWILNPGISIMGACVVINQNRDKDLH